MTRSNFLPVILGAALLSACGPTQVVVTAEIAQDDQSQDAEPRALGDLEIRLFPYDRDAIFDSLTATAARPEPPIPDSVLTAQNQVAESQQAWRDAEVLPASAVRSVSPQTSSIFDISMPRPSAAHWTMVVLVP